MIVKMRTIRTDLNANRAYVTKMGEVVKMGIVIKEPVNAYVNLALKDKSVIEWKMVITKKEVVLRLKLNYVIVIQLE